MPWLAPLCQTTKDKQTHSYILGGVSTGFGLAVDTYRAGFIPQYIVSNEQLAFNIYIHNTSMQNFKLIVEIMPGGGFIPSYIN